MIVQDVTVPSTFNPHDGPITHSSIGSKPDSLIHPLLPKLSLMLGFVCNSRANFPAIFHSGIGCNIFLHCSESLSHSASGNKQLPDRLKLPMISPYFALNIFLSFNSRVTLCHLLWCYQPDSQPCRGPFSRNTHPLFFHKYDGVPEERMSTSSWWPKAEKWRHQRKGSTSSKG